MAIKTSRRPPVERSCNLTLSRAEWSVLVSLLDRVRDPVATQAKIAIADAIRAADGAADISLDRECQKWAGVLNSVWKVGMTSREGREVCGKMTTQISAAEFTKAW